MGLVIFALWWAGYTAALMYFMPNECELTIGQVLVALVQSVAWPMTLPLALFRDRMGNC